VTGSATATAQVLVVEDRDVDAETVIRQVRAEFGEHCEIRHARTYEQAVELLASSVYDLVFLDLALHEPPGDRESWEGFWLLQDMDTAGMFPLTTVIVTSIVAERQDVRRLLQDFHAAYIWFKDDHGDLQQMLQDVRGATHDFGLSCELAPNGWSIDDTLLRLIGERHFERLTSPVTREDAAAELHHLLRRLFEDWAKVELVPMTSGASGAGVLRCARHGHEGETGSEVVVKFGLSTRLLDEEARSRLFKDRIGAMRATQVERSVVGRTLAATQYSLIGLAAAQVVSLEEAVREWDVDRTTTAIRNLFTDTCGLWYRLENVSEETNVVILDWYLSHFDASAETIANGYQYKFGLRSSLVDVPGAARLLPYPLLGLAEGSIVPRSNLTIRTLGHGDMHPGNVLVEHDAAACWLIDFGRAGWGHWARDFAELEASLRFQHLRTPEPLRGFEIESAFVNQSSLRESADLDPEDESEHRLIRIVATIRESAAVAAETVLAPEDAIFQYQVALYATTINYFRLHRLLKDKRRKQQIQLAAALLRERLTVPA
jgi:hypothetical protein